MDNLCHALQTEFVFETTAGSPYEAINTKISALSEFQELGESSMEMRPGSTACANNRPVEAHCSLVGAEKECLMCKDT